MRRKLYLGVPLAIFGIVAAGFIFSQTTGAQDAPKKAEPEQKKSEQDVFDLLRQKFEAKPDAQVPPTSKVTPPMPDLPLPTAQAPMPGAGSLPPLPPPSTALPTPNGTPPAQDLPKLQSLQLSPPPLSGPPTPPTGGLPTPPGTQGLSLPPQLPKQEAPPAPLPEPKLSNRAGDPTAPPPATPLNEPIKLKGSAWSLYVEMVNGQTVVTATVNKKHEFKIVCQHLDLQTGGGVMKAKGKVQIAGDALNGSCDQLTLPLHDDRLVLEGAAEVRIQKVTTNVSDAKPAAFELKGDKLDLRIGELQASAYLETSWRKVAGDASEGKPIPASMTPGDDAKKWTPYGKLRGTKSNEANVWSLVDSDGKTIAYVLAREGGSLDQYIGRTIAVYGAREGERGGQPLVRVTHIAVP